MSGSIVVTLPIRGCVNLRVGHNDQCLAPGAYGPSAIKFSRISGGPNT